jgi:Mlc titration factor MtfA (ptsG expression regulator)
MIRSWLQSRRRRKALASPFFSEWRDYLHHNVAPYRCLLSREQAKVRDDLRIFLADKRWQGRGVEVTDEVRVTVAAQACLLVLGLEHNYFDRIDTIAVCPPGEDEPRDRSGPAGALVVPWSGEGGAEVFRTFARAFALDSSLADLPPDPRWQAALTREYKSLADESADGRATLPDGFRAEDEGEFFGVATGCFFENAAEMQQHHPAVYDLLRTFYKQDPAARFAHRQKLLAGADREFGGETVL